MSAETLKEKMREFEAGKVGTVSVSSADLSENPDGAGEATQGTVTGKVPEEAKKGLFAESDAVANAHKALLPSYIEETIDISQDDRDAFLQSLVTGDRYERSFSLFGGKLTGIFRSRLIKESDGIVAWLQHLVNTGRIDARVVYLTMVRNAALATQVKSLRGMINEDFEELAKPLAPVSHTVKTTDKDGKTVYDVKVDEPGWLKAADAWGERPEALVTAIHVELQKFEKRYWTMIKEASNQNFWHPAAST